MQSSLTISAALIASSAFAWGGYRGLSVRNQPMSVDDWTCLYNSAYDGSYDMDVYHVPFCAVSTGINPYTGEGDY